MALRAIAKLTWPGTWEADAGVVSAEGGPSSPVRPLAAVMARAAEGRWGPGRPRVSSLFLLGRCMAAAAPRLAAAGHRDATGRSGACAGSPIEALCATVLSRTLTTGAASAGAKGGRGSLPGSTHPPLFRDDCPTVWRSSAFRAGVAALACVPGLPDVCPTLLKMAPLCAELLRALVPPEGSLIARAGKLRPVALRNLVSIASAALPAIAGRMRESASAVEERVERAAARSGSDARASMETREERERHEALCWSCVGVGAGLCVAAVELGWGGAGREEADAGAGGWDGARECEGGLGDLVAVADPLSEICLWPVGVAGGGSGADVAIADHGAALQLCEVPPCLVLRGSTHAYSYPLAS